MDKVSCLSNEKEYDVEIHHIPAHVAQTIDLLGVSCSYHNVRAKIIEI